MNQPPVGGRAIGCLPARADGGRHAARLRRIVPAGVEVRDLEDTVHALTEIATDGVELIALAFEPASMADSLEQLRQLRSAAPTVAIVAWGDIRAVAPHEVMTLAQLRISGILRSETETIRALVTHVLTGARLKAHSDALRQRVGPQVRASIRPVFDYGIQHAAENLDVPALSAVLGLSRRTLHHRLTRIGYPAPRVFLTWCRLLVAASLLDQPGRSLDDVAGEFDFPTGHGLGTVLRRYTGLSVGQLRQMRVSTAVEQAFLERIATAARRPRAIHSADSLPVSSSAD